jgi:hypothetical protein
MLHIYEDPSSNLCLENILSDVLFSSVPAMNWLAQGSNRGRGKNFSLLQNVQTSSEAHPASCSVSTVVLSWGKAAGP